MKVDPKKGLDSNQIASSKCNQVDLDLTKSYRQIITSNIFTFFNAINFVLAILVVLTGSYRNMLFMGVVVSNACIGIVQEIRSKRTLDRLALLHQPKIHVVRNGKEIEIEVEKIVENDIVVLTIGNQISVDGILVEGMLECNESALTGESHTVIKRKGDPLYSGSYVEAGYAKMQVLRVAEDTYAYSILHHAKREKKYPSQLRDSLNSIIKFSAILIVPMGILLFGKTYLFGSSTWKKATLSTVAALVGMIPEGLMILTSIALAIGALRLAKKKVLVQELYCIETLARVDTLCLDKTGTLTQGKMQVKDIEVLDDSYSLLEIKGILAKMFGFLQDTNSTANAIRNYCGTKQSVVKDHLSFSSKRKACAIRFEDSAFCLGAYSFLVKETNESLSRKLESYAKEGMRVVTLCQMESWEEEHIQANHKPIALVLIQDPIREDIEEILSYFKEQDVNIMIVSGDDPNTIQAIAKEAGIAGECCPKEEMADLDSAVEKYTIFGRVLPEQKRDIVRALKKKGHTVAMTGDGVNDVMALKEADCSIAMGSGSDASRQVASLVLLEDQFKSLPSILHRGRAIINNIERTASLFLVKTLLSLGCSLMTLFLLESYPFVPIQLTLIASLATGLPSFVLTLEDNPKRVTGHFLTKVFARAVPGAFCVLLAILGVWIFDCFTGSNMSHEQFSTICTLLAGANALCVLISVCNPMTKLRFSLVACMVCAFVVSILFEPLQQWFCLSIGELSTLQIFYIFINIPILFVFVAVITKLVNAWLNKKKL